MERFESLEEALKSPDKAEFLYVDGGSVTEIPDSIGELQNLKKLCIDDMPEGFTISPKIRDLPIEVLDITGQKDMSVPFPTILLETSVTDLEIRHFRVREIFPLKEQLKRFRLASYYIFDDITPLAKNLTNLEYLEIWGYHATNQAGNKKSLEFPPEIANLQSLKEIEIVSTGTQELPAEFAELSKLKTARFRALFFTSFPDALTGLPKLKSLEFSHMNQLAEIPDSLENMRELRTLIFRGSWNKGALPLTFEEYTFDPLPDVLGRLPKLKVLSLSHCGVESLDPIAGLANLRELSLAWAPLKDLSPISNFKKLKKLDLENAWVSDISPLASLPKLKELNLDGTNVKDLSPLANATKLKVLDISGCDADRNPAKALTPLMALPKLKTVKSREMEEDGWEKLKNAESIDADALLESLASDDLGDVVDALKKITLYSQDRSTDDMNALLDLFGLGEDLMDEIEPVEFEPLDNALERWGNEIPADVLAGIAGATFVSTYDGWNATLIAVKLLGERGDVDAQKKFVKAWFNATKYYDGGHRYWEDSVHDQLIDDLWGEFKPAALADLLADSPGDELDSYYGDGLDGLFLPTLSGLEEYHEGVMTRIRDYAFRNIDDSYGTPPTSTLEMIEACIPDAIEEVATELQAIADDMKKAMAGEAEEDSEEQQATPAEEPVAEESSFSFDEVFAAAFAESGVDGMCEALEEALEEEPTQNDLDVAAAYINNKLIQLLVAQEVDEAIQMMAAYEFFVEKHGLPGGAMRNELAGNTIVLVVYSGDENVKKFFFDTLLPSHIGHTGLAYNLSCWWATQGEKEKMLEAIRTAIELGKPASKFMNDTDFEPYWEDADFLAVVEA